jgi:hypothetical protein
MQAAAIASAIGIGGPAIASDTDAAGARRDASPSTFDTPSPLIDAVNANPEPRAADRSSNGAINDYPTAREGRVTREPVRDGMQQQIDANTRGSSAQDEQRGVVDDERNPSQR